MRHGLTLSDDSRCWVPGKWLVQAELIMMIKHAQILGLERQKLNNSLPLFIDYTFACYRWIY